MLSVAPARSLRGEKFSVGRFFFLLHFSFFFPRNAEMAGNEAGTAEREAAARPLPEQRDRSLPCSHRGRAPSSAGTRGEGVNKRAWMKDKIFPSLFDARSWGR